MCGIAGFCITKYVPEPEKILQDMIATLHHRGPDDAGTALYPTGEGGIVGFGHKRLSIIDLSSAGRQPMETIDGKLSIVFNGEIYNYRELREQLLAEGYRFQTHTDTEVILAMYQKYGIECLKLLNGMFAFALYDPVREEVYIVRDRLGIRPLYYYPCEEGLVFASEIKALLQYPGVKKDVDYDGIYQYAQSRYVRNPVTLFKHIKKVKPGSYLIYQNGRYSERQYWDVDNFEKRLSYNDALEQTESLLHDAVKLRMISDVPFGAFLSGGIDSSLIVALMTQYSSLPVKTFSVGYRDDPYSELKYANVIAEKFHTDHQELLISHRDVIDHLYQAVWHRDLPVSEPADIPIFLLAQAAKQKVSVILTGEGSDELFGGYPKYAYDHLANSAWFRLLANPIVQKMVDHLPYQYRKVKQAYGSLSIPNEAERYINWFASIKQGRIASLFTEEFKRQCTVLPDCQAFLKGDSGLDRITYFDLKTWLPDNLLERGDKMLMAHSVEGRVPFLDYRLVELAYQIDDCYKIKGKCGKYLIKKIAEKYIPKTNIYRKKVGFYTPLGNWFRNDLKEMLQEHLLSGQSVSRRIFLPETIKELYQKHISGVVNYEKELWMLLNLEIWFRNYID
jgi:asparagine synthase (glutamine-hydrolysing)